MEATERKSRGTTARDLSVIASGQGIDIDPEAKIPPAVLSVTPRFGSIFGGTSVQVKGRNFRPRSRVLFGLREARIVIYINAQTLICVTPPAQPGLVDVVVVNPSGLRGVLPRGFLYSLVGQVVQNLENAAEQLEAGTGAIDVAGLEEAAEMGAATSTMELEEGGNQIVEVDGLAELDDIDGQVPADQRSRPIVSSYSPKQGPAAGGTGVTFVGAQFRPRTRVFFAGRQAATIFINESTLVAITPGVPGPGSADIVLRNPSGLQSVIPNGFRYTRGFLLEGLTAGARAQAARGASKNAEPEAEGLAEGIDLQQQPPVVTSVTPNRVDTNGGKTVTIRGSNFRSGSTVTFGMLPATNVVFVSRSELRCTVPPHPAGNVKVRVTNQGSMLTGTLSMGFTYVQAPAPVLFGISPDTISSFGNTGINVFGANFAPGCLILLGAGRGLANYIDSTFVGFAAPPASPGTIFQVGVQNPDGQIACCAFLRYV
ncbi:MAG TPA: IPT/TIG domain-containing protein [Chloroflexia bacterium]|jgi:hypothetical protein|nr:IPT/TIG domain-containing protein [Chloroflexia bacterium]